MHIYSVSPHASQALGYALEIQTLSDLVPALKEGHSFRTGHPILQDGKVGPCPGTGYVLVGWGGVLGTTCDHSHLGQVSSVTQIHTQYKLFRWSGLFVLAYSAPFVRSWFALSLRRERDGQKAKWNLGNKREREINVCKTHTMLLNHGLVCRFITGLNIVVLYI